jgi:pyruvate-formate lyase-activating enzyme
MGSQEAPSLVYADEHGKIFDWPALEMAGSSAGEWHRLRRADWIPLPAGSELFVLPGRMPVGYQRESNRFEVLRQDPRHPEKPVLGVAAFMAPAHTQLYTAAYQTRPGAPLLPLFSYSALGWYKGQFVVAGTRVDPSERQDIRHFDQRKIARNARHRMARDRSNRLLQHLGNCALSYGCPAARNFFLERWEAPLPTSPSCNSRCLGCISLQQRKDLCATQERIAFVPTPEEIVGIAVPHLAQAPQAIVSFGQGCEGEPLLQAATIGKAIRLMRQATSRGTINLNSNGSLPRQVKELCDAGLESLRVSINSCRADYYHAYYQPHGYSFRDVRESIRVVKAHGGFASINYLVLPGVTDEEPEFEALCGFIRKSGLDLIQMRNLNIDPEWYLASIQYRPAGKKLGIRNLMTRLRDRFPDLRFGYFNPCLDLQAL